MRNYFAGLLGKATFHHTITTWKYSFIGAAIVLLHGSILKTSGAYLGDLAFAAVFTYLTLFIGQELTLKGRAVFKLAELGKIVQALTFWIIGTLVICAWGWLWPSSLVLMHGSLLSCAMQLSAAMLVNFVIVGTFTGFFQSVYDERSYLPLTWPQWKEKRQKKTDNKDK